MKTPKKMGLSTPLFDDVRIEIAPPDLVAHFRRVGTINGSSETVWLIIVPVPQTKASDAYEIVHFWESDTKPEKGIASLFAWSHYSSFPDVPHLLSQKRIAVAVNGEVVR